MTETKACLMAGCIDDHAARGVCKNHYNDWYAGRIELPLGAELAGYFTDPEDAFAARTRRVGDHLLWTGPTATGGGGRISVGGKQTTVRRYVWEREHGPLPRGRVVRVTCDQPACVELAHIRVPRWGQGPGTALPVPEEVDEALPISVTPLGDAYLAVVGEVYREVFPTFALAATGAMQASARHAGE